MQHLGLSRSMQPGTNSLSASLPDAAKVKGKRDASTQGLQPLHRPRGAASPAAAPRTCQVSVRAGAGHFPHHQHERFN